MTRKWFQIHLSTAVVLMFVAGLLLWANIDSYVEYVPQGNAFASIEFGFPWKCFRHNTYNVTWEFTLWHPLEVCGNVLVNIGILIAGVIFPEYLIRRHETRKP